MRRHSLWPREHGAYFQLAIPLATACAARSPTSASLALATGAVLAFLAHEPLRVLLGHRGARRVELDGARARRRLALLGLCATAAGAVGLVAEPAAIAAAAFVLVPVLAVLVLAWRRAEHTLVGELAAAIALTGASVPVLVAAGASVATALAHWLGWALGFAATVVAVHRVIARHKRRATAHDAALAISLLAAAASALTRWPPLVLALPLVAVSALLVIAPPPASRLRAIGVAIVVASIAAAALAQS